jgi:hypothetical protein
VKPDAADDIVGLITHIVIIVRPYSATAFAGLDENKLILRTRHDRTPAFIYRRKRARALRAASGPESRVALIYKADRASGIERARRSASHAAVHVRAGASGMWRLGDRTRQIPLDKWDALSGVG